MGTGARQARGWAPGSLAGQISGNGRSHCGLCWTPGGCGCPGAAGKALTGRGLYPSGSGDSCGGSILQLHLHWALSLVGWPARLVLSPGVAAFCPAQGTDVPLCLRLTEEHTPHL